jgi:DNA invertase Pin-like site-specific DNA recombinase
MQVGYARVSTRDQDLSIQLEALDRAGCHPIHEEKASGARGKDRPVRDAMLRQLEHGDTLVVYKLDRLGRSIIDVLGIVEELERRGVALKVLTQPVDTSDPAGKMFLQLLAVFAEFERSMILERTAAGRAWRDAQGLPRGRPRMFGTVGMGQTTVSPEQAEAEAELIREAATRVLNGEPMNRIVGDWNARGIPARGTTKNGVPSAGLWAVNALRRVLTNPQSAAIVGPEVHHQLAKIFDNRANRRQKLGPPAEHLLSGILACAKCGEPMYATWKTARNKTREHYYRCKPGSGSGGRFKGCGSTGISLTRSDEFAREMFIAAMLSDELADTINKREAELLAGDMTAETLAEMRREIEELEQVMPTRFAPPDAKQRHAELQRQVRDATARLMAAPELEEMRSLPRTEDELRARWEGWSTGQRREWLRRLVERIDVAPATTFGKAAVPEARMSPVWKI